MGLPVLKVLVVNTIILKLSSSLMFLISPVLDVIPLISALLNLNFHLLMLSMLLLEEFPSTPPDPTQSQTPTPTRTPSPAPTQSSTPSVTPTRTPSRSTECSLFCTCPVFSCHLVYNFDDDDFLFYY